MSLVNNPVLLSVKYVDQTASRAIDGTEYQASTYNRLILVSLDISQGVTPGNAFVLANTKSTSPANTTQTEAGTVTGGIANSEMFVNLSMFVQPFYYYKITATQTNNGTVTLLKWIEIDLI